MPFKVRFSLYEQGKLAPCSVTYDRNLAHAQVNDMIRKGAPLPRLVHDITCENLTKPEAYVFLVYRVLRAIRKYYDERGKVSKQQSSDNLKVSLAIERELDNWNKRTREYLNTHSADATAQYSFFILVEAWRNLWHKYFSYKKQADKDPVVEKEMRNQCFAYEREIDKYVTNAIGL